MFSKLRSPKPPAPAAHPTSSSPMHKQRTPAATTPKSAPPPSINHSRKPSFADHQWEERHWTKPFVSGVTQVAATLRFPPEQTDMHDLRRVPEEENLYGKAQKHSKPSSKCSTKSSASSLKSSASSIKSSSSVKSSSSSVKSSSSSVKSSSSSVKSSASSVKSVASSKSSVTLSSKASASSLWSERPSSSASNATHATSWSVDSSAPTVMTDLSKCNSNRPDSCTLGDFDAFKLRPKSTVSSNSGTSCAGTIQSRPRTAKSSKNGDISITFEIVAEEDDAIYLQRTPNPQPAGRRRQWG